MGIVNFLVEVSIPVVIGFAVSRYLQEVTTRLLCDLCGTYDRSEFWVRVNAIMITGIPLILSLAFGRSSNPGAAIEVVARHALMMTVLGIVVSVAVVARMIMRNLPDPATRSALLEIAQ